MQYFQLSLTTNSKFVTAGNVFHFYGKRIASTCKDRQLKTSLKKLIREIFFKKVYFFARKVLKVIVS